MQLSPLQSRLAASLAASLIVVFIYLYLFGSNVAQASEVLGSSGPILDVAAAPEQNYEPEFAAFDPELRGEVYNPDVVLDNDAPVRFSLAPGATKYFIVKAVQNLNVVSEEQEDAEADAKSNEVEGSPESFGSDDLRRRQSTRPLYISANTCRHPTYLSVTGNSVESPQLTMYISTSSTNTAPGPNHDFDQVARHFVQGAAVYQTNMLETTYIGITAPETPSDAASFSGEFSVEIAMSYHGMYHNYDEDNSVDLRWLDSDSRSALLAVKGLSPLEERDVESQDDYPFVLFAHRVDSSSIDGVRRSFCGLQNYADISSLRGDDDASIDVSVNVVGKGDDQKHQFHIKGLSPGVTYSGILVQTSGRTITLGKRQESGADAQSDKHHILQSRQVTTQTGDNCQVVTNLTFCEGFDYAVPANPLKFNTSEALGQFYDDYARSMYDNFEKSIMQVPCEAPDEAQYSLVRTCDDCRQAYKVWLCAVALPRCEDLSSDNPFAHLRNLGQALPNGTAQANALAADLATSFPDPAFQASRNPIIDTEVAPGPYLEVLPCQELCYELIQTCPASMGFKCPAPGMGGFADSYGERIESNRLSCNFPSVARVPSGAAARGSVVVGWMGLVVVLVAAWTGVS